jgi:hypothetical protein
MLAAMVVEFVPGQTKPNETRRSDDMAGNQRVF